MNRSARTAETVSDVYLALMLSAFLLWTGPDGYTKILEAKYRLFLLLTIDLCGTAMVLATPTAPEGDGFYSYTVKEGSKDVTHYYVTHYEVGEKAEELTVMATGKQLTYQWYYRLSEDETEAGTAIN